MTGHRQVQQFFCQKCNGTGFTVETGGLFATCHHMKRTDVTGTDDDFERIRQLEDTISRMHAAADEAVAKAREEALEEALETIRAKMRRWNETPISEQPGQTVLLELMSLHAMIRSLKRKP